MKIMARKRVKVKKLIYGVGINDAKYAVNPKINGKYNACPIYKCWLNILRRCYSEKFQETTPSYVGCSVDGDWFYFSRFHKWMSNQNWHGKQIDKDILIQGNKVYGPNTCIFVTQEINKLVAQNKRKAGKYLLGVTFDKHAGKYKADSCLNGKIKYLGLYDTEAQAHEAYKSFKQSLIYKVASEQSEPLRTALLNYVVVAP